MKRAVGRVNYEVVMPERRIPNVIFHVNMLKKWNQRGTGQDEDTSETALHIEEAEIGDTLEADIPDWDPIQKLIVGSNLSETQHREIDHLLTEFEDIVSDKPGRTHLIQHHG